jgi:hypothetical protein
MSRGFQALRLKTVMMEGTVTAQSSSSLSLIAIKTSFAFVTQIQASHELESSSFERMMRLLVSLLITAKGFRDRV